MGVVLFLSMMSNLDLLFIRLEEDPVWLPDLGPEDGVNPRPPLARTFLPGLTTLPAGALELFRAEVLEDTPGDFLMVGPFLTTTSCSLMISPTEILRAAEAFSKDTCIVDFFLDFLLLFNPADSFIACSSTLTLSVSLAVFSSSVEVAIFCLVLDVLFSFPPSVSLDVLSSSVVVTTFCLVLDDLTDRLSLLPSVSLAVLSSVVATIFCLDLEVLTDLPSSPSFSLAVLSSSVDRTFCLVLVDLLGGAASESPLLPPRFG